MTAGAYRVMDSATVLEWGDSTAVTECGMLLATLGARVVRVGGAGRDDPNGIPVSHLDRRKEIVQRPVADENLDEWLAGVDLVVTDGTLPFAADLILARGVDIVSVTPFGLVGDQAGASGGDLIASHAGGYAHYLTWSVDDPASEPPSRGPQGQAQLVSGLTAAVAAAARLVGRVRGRPAELVDVSEQDAVATLLLPQLSERTEGTLKQGRRRARGGSKVAGGLVGLLPCADGHVIVSPREDHQWNRLMGILGDPAWGAGPQAATAAARMTHWETLQERLGSWSVRHPKESVFRRLQAARIPCFPVNRVADALAVEQLRLRRFWYRGPDGAVGPGAPFHLAPPVPELDPPAPVPAAPVPNEESR